MNNGKVDRKEMVEQFVEKSNELDLLSQVEDLIKDNKIEFYYNDKEYRVRKPTQKEKMELSKFRMSKKIELIKDPKFLFKEEWKRIYKEKGIDADEIENQIKDIQLEVNDLLVKIDENRDNDEIANRYVELVKEKRAKIFELSSKLNEIYEYSIEETLESYTNSYLCYLVLERKEGDNWVRNYSSFEDYTDEEDDQFIIEANKYLLLLILKYE